MGITTAASKLPPLKPGEFRFVTNGLQIEMQPSGEDAKGRRRFKAIASSTAKDMRGDEMQMSAMEDMVASFRRGLNVFMDHNHTAENVFGRTDSAYIQDSGQRDPRNGAVIWDLHVGGTVNEPNKKAMELADSIDGGYVSFGTSIGAFVTQADKKKDGGRSIAHVDCKELSIVGIPMQQRAWTYKSADANWTKKAADAAETMLEQNALFDGEDGPQAVETFSLDPEAVVTAPEAPEPVLDAPAAPEPVVIRVLNSLDTKERVQSALAWLATDGSRRDEVIAAARAFNLGDATAKGLSDEELLVFAATDPDTMKAAAAICGSCGHDHACSCADCSCDNHAAAGDTDHDGDDPAHGNDPDMDGKSADDAALETKSDTTTGGQEASEATPETAPAATDEPDPAPVQKALSYEAEDVVALVGHVRTLTGLLDEKDARVAFLTASLAEKDAEIDRLTAENEAAGRVIEKVMSMPLRRKAVSEVQTFSAQMPDFLAPAVRRLLENH